MQVAKILRNSQANFAPLVLEHLQQHKTKNYEKLSLKIKKIHKNWKLKDINEITILKIEIKQTKNLIKIWSGFHVPAGTTPC